MLHDVLPLAGREFGERVAYIAADGWPITYRELDRLSDELAVWLAVHAGVREGSVVALVMPSTPDYIVAFGAVAKLGAVSAGVNALLTPREREGALSTAEPDVVLADPGLLEGIPAAARVIEVAPADHAAAIWRGHRAAGEAPPRLADDPDRAFTICFTSGSTGMPKGALFRDRQIRAIALSDTGGTGAGWGIGTHSIASTQFAHVGGMTKIPWMLAGGGTIHLMHRWRAATVMQLTHEHRMPALNAGPTQVALMLRQPDFDRFDFSCVKALVVGTGPSSPALIQEARERFRAPYSVRYSSTESGGIGLLTALDAPDEEALYTVGRPRQGIDAMIAGDDLRPLPPGEIGEVCLRSPAVMSEYYRNPAETAATLVKGWLRTGDLGFVDEAGCYRLAGRKKEMFIRGGYNVYPLEVEKVLSTHPKVHEVALVPRPDAVMGEIGVAVIVPTDPHDPPSLDELRDHGARGLARYKLPEAVRVITEMPLNATHKLDRRSLAAIERGGDAAAS